MFDVSSVQVAESDPAGEIVIVLCAGAEQQVVRMSVRLALELSSRAERVAGGILERRSSGEERTHYVGEEAMENNRWKMEDDAEADAALAGAVKAAPSARELMGAAMAEDEDMRLGMRGIDRLRNEYQIGPAEELPGPVTPPRRKA